MKTLKVEETRQSMKRLSVDSTAEDKASRGKSGFDEDDKRSSIQLSTFSGDSRRQSLFLADDELPDDEEEDGTEGEGAEDEDTKDDQRLRRRREDFVDKTRASAMVAAGTKDIKEALEKQKKAEIFRRTPEARAAATLFKQARFLMHQSRFREALVFIDKALETDPERKEWMTEKGRCYLSILQPHATLRYVDYVLERDPQFFPALLLKGEALYSLWDLERAMLCFVEGRRLRPENEHCARGMHKVRMALDEIAAYRATTSKRKFKKKSKRRSKSAKARLTSPLSPSDAGFLTSGGKSTPSPDDAVPSGSGLALFGNQAMARLRPKTAVGERRLSVGRSLDAGPRHTESRSTTASYRSASTLRIRSPKDDVSDASSDSTSPSRSSSVDDVSSKTPYRSPPVRVPTYLKARKNSVKQKQSTCMGPKISKGLDSEKRFLDNILKDKELRRSKSPFTRRAMRLAKDVRSFVAEREVYWKNREQFVRYAHGDDSDFET